MRDVSIEQGTYGSRAVLLAPWHKDMLPYLKQRQVVELELNVAKGWHGQDISFFDELLWLCSLDILSLGLEKIEPIHCLTELRRLGVTAYGSSEIRFSCFPQLEDCALEWRRKATSIFECRTLRRLFVNRYDGKNTDAFSNLVQLESLAILNAPVRDLHGLSKLRGLRSLRIANLKRVTSLAGIENLTNLEKLNVNTCRGIRSVEEVGALLKLRELYLDNLGEIDSLRPLENLTALERVGFCESTNVVDGDLASLLGLPNLSLASFQNRRHYSHRREELPANKGGHRV